MLSNRWSRHEKEAVAVAMGIERGVLTFLFFASSSLAYAQESLPPIPSQADFMILTDMRVGIVKAALQLTPEQEKLCPL